MAFIYDEPSHTFGEYLLIPGYSSCDCVPSSVSLKTPVVRYRKGEEECPLTMNIPLVSAIMQSVSNDTLAIALAKEGGISFIYGSQSVESEAKMVANVKSYKAGFVVSDSNIRPDATLADILALKEKTGHSTVAVTEDGTAEGRLVGIVASRDYRISRMSLDEKVSSFMTPIEKLIVAGEETTLKEANDIIWDNKLNSLPIVAKNGTLKYAALDCDYSDHKANPLELLDKHKRYLVGAGINTPRLRGAGPRAGQRRRRCALHRLLRGLLRVAEAHAGLDPQQIRQHRQGRRGQCGRPRGLPVSGRVRRRLCQGRHRRRLDLHHP